MKKLLLLFLINSTLACTSTKEKNDPLFDGQVFQLSDTKSIFKYAKHGRIMYWYALNGVAKDHYKEEPFFNVMVLPNDRTLPEAAESVADFIQQPEIKNLSLAPTNDLPSIQREIYGERDGKPALLFQHLVLVENNIITMSGIADKDFDKNLAEFKKLSATIKKK